MRSLAFFLLVGVALFGASVHGISELLPGIRQSDGKIFYTDYLREPSIAELSSESGIKLLGSTIVIDPLGKDYEIRLVLAIVAFETNGIPRNPELEISGEIRSSTNVSAPDNILSEFNFPLPSLEAGIEHKGQVAPSKWWGHVYNSVIPGRRACGGTVQIVQHSRNPLASSESLFIDEFVLKFQLRSPSVIIPEYIFIDINNTDTGCILVTYTRRERSKLLQDATTSNGNIVDRAINLQIAREKDSMLLTCSRPVEDATLEEADPSVSPLIWCAVKVPYSKQANGWFVAPEKGTRIFRVRVPE